MKNEIIRDVVLKYIKEKPALIRLKVDLNSQTSEITLKGQSLDKNSSILKVLTSTPLLMEL